jgi:hypothetical protein
LATLCRYCHPNEGKLLVLKESLFPWHTPARSGKSPDCSW